MRAASLALLTLALVGCPKQVETTRVAGSDDDQIAAYEARLEELSSKGTERNLTCDDRCALAPQTCTVAENLCKVVGDHPERTDLPAKCAKARETCAEGTDTCTSCRTR